LGGQLISREAQASVLVEQILACTHTLTDVVDRAVIDVGAHADFVSMAISKVCLFIPGVALAVVVLVCLTCWFLVIDTSAIFTTIMKQAIIDVKEGHRLTVLTRGQAGACEGLL
jgi:hypothetical protein